jgi:O-antigen ligase/tetratricopeptide (TPR) repeat protein
MRNSNPSRAPAAGPGVAVRTPGAAFGLGLLLVVLVLAPLLFSTATLGAFEYPKVALLCTAAILFVALGLCALLPRRPALSGSPLAMLRQPLLLGVVLFLLSAALSTAFSINPLIALVGTHDSHAGLCTLAAYGVLFFAARGLCRGHDDARLLLGGCLVAGGVAAAYALLQFLGLDPVHWDDPSKVGAYVRPFGTLGNPNLLAAYLVMTLPLTVFFAARAARARRWLTLAALAMVGLLSSAAIVLSVSRAAWLALACGGVVLLVGTLAARGWGPATILGLPRGLGRGLGAALRGLARDRVALLALPLILGGVVVAVFELGGHQALWQAVRERLANLDDALSRRHIWNAGLAIFRDHPLLGTGPDTFQLAFGLKRTAAYWQVEWNATPARAHNEFIHVLATQGLVGAAAVLLGLVGLAAAGWRAWGRAPAEARPLVLAVLAGATAFLVQSAFSFTVADQGILFAVMAGVLARLGEAPAGADAGAPAAGRRWFPIALGCACLLASLVFAVNFAGQGSSAFGFVVAAVALAVVLAAAAWAVGLDPQDKQVEERGARTNGRRRSSDVRVAARSARPDPRAPSRRGLWRLARFAVWGGAAAVVGFGVLGPLQANVMCCHGERLLARWPREAVSLLARAAVMDPTKELHWTKLGAGAQAALEAALDGERGELWRMARGALRQAAQLSPLNAYHHDNLGLLLGRMARERLADVRDAYAAFDRALALDPGNVNFYADAANAALAVRDLARARSYAARGCDVFPQFGPTRGQLGYVCLQEGRHQEAVTMLREALRLNWYGQSQGYVIALANLAAAHLQLGQYQESADAGRQALSMAPGLADVRCNFARALEELGRTAEAAAEYRRIVEHLPRHGPAQAGLRRTTAAQHLSTHPLGH